MIGLIGMMVDSFSDYLLVERMIFRQVCYPLDWILGTKLRDVVGEGSRKWGLVVGSEWGVGWVEVGCRVDAGWRFGCN